MASSLSGIHLNHLDLGTKLTEANLLRDYCFSQDQVPSVPTPTPVRTTVFPCIPQVLSWLGQCRLQSPIFSSYLMALTQHMALLLPVACWRQVSLSPERLFSSGTVGRDRTCISPAYDPQAPGRCRNCPAYRAAQSATWGWGSWGQQGFLPV